MKERGFLFMWANLVLLLLSGTSVLGVELSPAAYRADRILIQPTPAAGPAALADFHAAQKIEVLQTFEWIARLQVLRVPADETDPGLSAKYQLSARVAFVE